MLRLQQIGTLSVSLSFLSFLLIFVPFCAKLSIFIKDRRHRRYRLHRSLRQLRYHPSSNVRSPSFQPWLLLSYAGLASQDFPPIHTSVDTKNHVSHPTSGTCAQSLILPQSILFNDMPAIFVTNHTPESSYGRFFNLSLVDRRF